MTEDVSLILADAESVILVQVFDNAGDGHISATTEAIEAEVRLQCPDITRVIITKNYPVQT